MHWYRLAAAQRHPQAQGDLGWMYAKGEGVLQDFVRSHSWFNVAAVSGNAEAAKGRDQVAQQMTTQQIGQAQKMARELKQRHFQDFD